MLDVKSKKPTVATTMSFIILFYCPNYSLSRASLIKKEYKVVSNLQYNLFCYYELNYNILKAVFEEKTLICKVYDDISPF